MTDLVYLYDGSFAGFLCCIFESYAQREIPTGIYPEEDFLPTLFPTRAISTDQNHALRVYKKVTKCSPYAAELLRRGFLTCLPQKEEAMYRLVEKLLREGPLFLRNRSDETLYPVAKAGRHLEGEAHLLKGFTRFSDLGGDATVEYFKGSTKVTPIDADNYKAVITLGNKSFWAKGDDTDKSRMIDFYITKKALAYPKWFDDVNEMDYGGDGKLYYTLSNDYDKDAIDIKVPDALKDKVTFDSDEITATGLDVGTYSREVSLKDTKNYQWATTGNKLEFIVNPKTRKLTDLSDGGNRTLVSSRDSALNLSLKIDANTTVHTGKQVAVNIVAQTDGLSKVVGTATLDVTSRDVAVDLKFTGTPNGRTYQLVVEIDDTKLDGKNYALNQDSFETTVRLQEGVRSMLTWQLMCDGKEVFGEYTDASVNQTSISFSGAPIVYNGKSYKFRVLLPDGYEMNTSFGIGGYKVTASTPRGDGTNADSYTTQIQLTSDGNKQIFEITWEIQKAKFDLSAVVI